MPGQNQISGSHAADFGDPAGKSEMELRGERLREAIKAAGGLAAVVARTGMSESTVGNYQSGGEFKLSNAIKLARATGVRLEWLATGQGPRTESESQANTPEAPQPAASTALLSDVVDLERMIHAYRAARQVTEKDEDLVQLMLRFHDVLAAQEASRPTTTTSGNHPELATVKAP